MPVLAAWTPDVDRPYGVHAPALDRSQVTEVEPLIRPTISVLLSGPAPVQDSAMSRARLVMEALGGEIEDPAVRKASGRVLFKRSHPVGVTDVMRGRPPQGF